MVVTFEEQLGHLITNPWTAAQQHGRRVPDTPPRTIVPHCNNDMVGGPPEMYIPDPGVLVFFSEWWNAFLFCVPPCHHHDEVVEALAVFRGDPGPPDR